MQCFKAVMSGNKILICCLNTPEYVHAPAGITVVYATRAVLLSDDDLVETPTPPPTPNVPLLHSKDLTCINAQTNTNNANVIKIN